MKFLSIILAAVLVLAPVTMAFAQAAGGTGGASGGASGSGGAAGATGGGTFSLKTTDGMTLDLHAPPSALSGVKKGDRMSVEIAVQPTR
jgi:hypothetical protein